MYGAGKHLSESASNLRARAGDFARVMAWIYRFAAKQDALRIIASAVLAIASVALQIASIFLIVRIMRKVQLSQPLIGERFDLAGYEWVANFAPHVFLIAAIALVCLAGLARFLSRSMAIEIDLKLNQALMDHILGQLRALHHQTVVTNLFRQHSLQAIMRSISSDIRFCSLVVRLTIFNALQFAYLVVGVGILIIYSPLLFGLFALFLVPGILVMYPLNLSAVRRSEMFEKVAPQRGGIVQRSVKGALLARYMDDANGPQNTADEELNSEFLSLYGYRFRVMEISNFVVSIMFAAAIGIFLWLVLFGNAKELINLTNLVFLLFAFRYSYMGTQGIMVLSTAISRFFPGMVRVFNLVSTLQKLEKATQGIVLPSTANAVGERTFEWSVHQDDDEVVGGAFEPGQVHCVISPTLPGLVAVSPLINIVTGRRSEFAAQVMTSISRRPWRQIDQKGAADPDVMDAALTRALLTWVGKILSEGGMKITPKRIKEIAKSENTLYQPYHAAVSLLIGAEIKSRSPHLIVLLDGDPFLQQPMNIRKAILRRMSGKIVFIYTSNRRELKPISGVQHFFISDGQHIVMAIEGKCADRTTQKRVAQKLGLDAGVGDIAMQDELAAAF